MLVAHYYGSVVRTLFVIAAIFILVFSTLFGDILPWGIHFKSMSILALLLLAGLTNPRTEWVMIADGVAAAAGFIMVQTVALGRFAPDSVTLFAIREIAGLVFMFAFYFSMKTVRAMELHQIGKHFRPREFDAA